MQKKLLWTEEGKLIEVCDEFYELSKKLWFENQEHTARDEDYEPDPKLQHRWGVLHQEYMDRYNTSNYYVQFALWDHFDGDNDFIDINEFSSEEIAELLAPNGPSTD